MKFILTILTTLILASVTNANIIEVCPTCPVKSIKQAIQLSRPCDTVLVKVGFYSEGRIFIDKGLTLLGENWPILDGKNKTEVFTVTADFVTIQGFQIQNVGTSYTEDRAGIRVKESRYFSIRNNRLLDAFFAIYLQKSKEGVVEGNVVEGHAKDQVSSGNAIHLWHCENVQILGNKVSGYRDGIYLEFAKNSLIAENRSEGNIRYGLHFMFSDGNTYRHNIFRKNGSGVAVMYSHRIHMVENTFEHSWGAAAYGLLLKEIHDSHIEGNLFQNNTVGIFTETSNRVTYTKNQFLQNGWAMRISGGCQQNTVTQNNFQSNSFDLAVQVSGKDNSFDGNFWSDYTGYDLDRDGIGDVPYRPMKLFSYVVSKTPEAMVLLRSLFVDILNFSEKVSPIFTPENVVDNQPLMKC